MTFAGLDPGRVATIIQKEFLVLFYNPISRFMIIVPPLMQLVIFGWAATMEVRNVDVGVLNHDEGKWSREIIHQIEGSPTFKSVVWLSGEKEAATRLNNQDVLFVITFDEEFSRNVERGRNAEAQLLMDGRRSNAAQITASYINRILQNVGMETPLAQKAAHAIAPGVNMSARCWFNPNLEFQWYFLPNLIGMLILMVSLVVTGLSVAKEREMGTFDQLLVSPATPTEIAIAKLIPGCIIGLAHGTIFIIIAIWGFGVPFNGSMLILYTAMLIFSLSCGGIGLMVSSLSSTQQQAFLGAFTVGVPCVLISGAVTPLSNMPPILQTFSQINPLCHFTIITQGVFLKDITLSAALMSMGKIVILTIISVSVAVWMFKRGN